MTPFYPLTFVAALMCLCMGNTEAFVLAPPSQQHLATSAPTTLNLVPGQGQVLVDAFNAAVAVDEDIDGDFVSDIRPQGVSMKRRSIREIAERLFKGGPTTEPEGEADWS